MSRAKWERDTLRFCAKRSFQFQLTLQVRQHAQNEEKNERNAACDNVAIDRDCDADGRCSQESSGGSQALHPGAARPYFCFSLPCTSFQPPLNCRFVMVIEIRFCHRPWSLA